MRRLIMSGLIAVLILTAGILLKGSITQPSIGNWLSAGPMIEARSSAASALLHDGRILITGGDNGSGPVASAEFFDATGAFVAAPPMSIARSAHTATVLPDGRVLVAGGSIGTAATNAAEIFDPAATANAWTPVAGGMIQARSNHTASLLADGRVLFAGGDNAGAPTASLEVFDPIANSFSFVGVMSAPRMSFASAVLADGRVMLIGGSNGSAPVASTEIFDPLSNSVTAGPALSAPRMAHSATSLLDGRVLLAGGNNIVTNADGSTAPADLASAEIYDPATGSFAVSASPLAAPRRDHAAFLLPNNNSVLIVGGTSAGADVATAELFVPSTSTFAATGSPAAARQHATGAALSQDGILFLAGGSNSSGTLATAELYGFATVKTDKVDYAPGEIVTITGSGWQPGETVTLTMVEKPLIDTHGPFTTVADSTGRIFYNQFSPDVYDISIRFYLTAVGSVSGLQAQNMFADAPKNYNATVSPSSGSAGAAITYTVKIENDPSSGTQQIGDATITIPSGFSSATLGTLTQPAGFNWTASLSSGTVTLLANNGASKLAAGQSVSIAITATDPCTAGSYAWNTTAGSNATGTQNDFSLVGSQPSVTITGSCTVPTTLVLNSVSPNSVPFGSSGPVTFTATLTRNDTAAGVGGATINFTVDGGSAGSTTTGIGGVATFTSYNPSALFVAAHNVGASFTSATIGGTNFGSSTSDTLALTVGKATPTITWANPADITYGTGLSATQLNASASVPGSFVYTPPSGTKLNAGAGQNLHADFTPTDTANYNNAAKDVSINVLKGTPVITWGNPADIIYGTALSETQLNASASVPGSLVYTPAAGTLLNPSTGQPLTVNFTPTDTNNYNSVSKTVYINIGYGICSVGPGDVILPPINSDGTSVYQRKGGSTIPVKFRVCNASGASISNPAVVFAPVGGSLTMLSAVRGTIDSVNENAGTDVPDVAFRWDASGQQWIFNMATSNLTSGSTDTFRINLAYTPASITFVVGVK